jgi:hypothetical protein
MTKRIPCPACGRPKPEFAIRNGRCRDDIMDEERKRAQKVTIGWNDIRAERNKRLTASDWTQIADAPVDAKAWAGYRTALRDITRSYEAPENVEWPVPPA